MNGCMDKDMKVILLINKFKEKVFFIGKKLKKKKVEMIKLKINLWKEFFLMKKYNFSKKKLN